MSDLMLHGVLNMPPTLWHDSDLDTAQRFSRYKEASQRIKDLDKKLDQAIDLLDASGRARLLSEWA